jgi:hypothetical protein
MTARGPPTLRFATRDAGSLCRLLHTPAVQLVVVRPGELVCEIVKPRAVVIVNGVEVRSVFSVQPHLGAPFSVHVSDS